MWSRAYWSGAYWSAAYWPGGVVAPTVPLYRGFLVNPGRLMR